jgi:molecular chaperone GrpE
MNQDKKTPEAPESIEDMAPDETIEDSTADAPEAPEDESVVEAFFAEQSTEESPEDEIERLSDEVAELNDKLLRAVAETENLRRRTTREREETGKYAVTGFARDLLSVADNLRRALDSLSDDNRADESLGGLISGVEATERELLAVFERNKISRIDPEGEKFDHNFHQAMFEVADSGQPAGTVVNVMQPGYVIADRLLRPAMVGIAKGGNGNGEGDDGDAKPHIDTKA